MADFDIFMSTAPGLEPLLAEEAVERGFAEVAAVPGGVTLRGGWRDVWRANLEMRGAAHVLLRFAEFRAMHLAQLDKRARRIDWGAVLRPDRPVRVEAHCRRSRIYHDRAAAERIGRAINQELGAPLDKAAAIVVKARIEDDLVTLSVDTSGAPLHRRGLKQAVGKAPMRENLAALFLRACGYRGGERVVDPMCGSGTFPIEAAEIAAGLQPGRARGFAFEALAGFDKAAFDALRRPAAAPGQSETAPHAFGQDRDQGAVRMATANAERAGVDGLCGFACAPVSALRPPAGPPGLVIANPPYGGRIGNRKPLVALYDSFGQVLRAHFAGWRVGLITSEPALARATARAMGMELAAGPPVAHGGLRVRLYRAGPL